METEQELARLATQAQTNAAAAADAAAATISLLQLLAGLAIGPPLQRRWRLSSLGRGCPRLPNYFLFLAAARTLFQVKPQLIDQGLS